MKRLSAWIDSRLPNTRQAFDLAKNALQISSDFKQLLSQQVSLTQDAQRLAQAAIERLAKAESGYAGISAQNDKLLRRLEIMLGALQQISEGNNSAASVAQNAIDRAYSATYQ